MNTIEAGQVSQSAADVYEQFFLPALFSMWPQHVATAAQIKPGDHVLDVACGTGVLARYVANNVGETGSVVGIDINEGMLAVAQHKAPHVTWQHGAAEQLPFVDNQFDAVVSQFGLMFFEDQPQALREMFRVLRPGGHLAVAVWSTLDETPGYAAVVALLQRLFGAETANGIRTPYNLGDKQAVRALFAEANLNHVTITTRTETARFASIKDWMYTDIKGWVLADMIDDDQFAILLKEADQALRPFLTPDGSVEFAAPAHIVTAVKG